MTGILWAVLGLFAGLVMTAFGDMFSEEMRDRLDHLPHAILRLAARRLTPSQRITVYQDEWLPELTYILKGVEARPITRLFTGTAFALGIFINAARISRRLNRRPPTDQTAIAGSDNGIDSSSARFSKFLVRLIMRRLEIATRETGRDLAAEALQAEVLMSPHHGTSAPSTPPPAT
jgi:hypothetical protein